MTPEQKSIEILCWKYIYYSIMYYLYYHSEVPDSEYDNICLTLKLEWKKLPDWFKERVCLEDLSTGSGFALKPTCKELDEIENFLYGNVSLPMLNYD
jgi:NAD-dependent DNA ligase